MADLHGDLLQVVKYDTSEETGFDFVTPVRAALGMPDDVSLAEVHTTIQPPELVTRETDQSTDLHARYYENVRDTDFYETYRRFVRQVITPLVGEPIYTQRIPSFRVQLPGNKAVGGKYHRDDEFGHQPAVINFWVPVTDAYGSNALHIKDSEEEAPKPFPVPLGSFLAFDAINLYHGNELNTTEDTRISFDFRVIHQSEYQPSDAVSINTETPLTVGNYYVTPQEIV